jgi:hypothetical protein
LITKHRKMAILNQIMIICIYMCEYISCYICIKCLVKDSTFCFYIQMSPLIFHSVCNSPPSQHATGLGTRETWHKCYKISFLLIHELIYISDIAHTFRLLPLTSSDQYNLTFLYIITLVLSLASEFITGLDMSDSDTLFI